MDCPSEENLIRMKLGSLDFFKLDFDLERRTLYVFHEHKEENIESALNELNLGSKKNCHY